MATTVLVTKRSYMQSTVHYDINIAIWWTLSKGELTDSSLETEPQNMALPISTSGQFNDLIHYT